ncbi:hypothetical protein HPB49_026218 [Dermacentor silvarum]|nr:hypothetical protein HPB49_026218 [Dermacentor silvarum]
MHGARKRSKWEELYQMLDAEDMLLYAVAETHLLGIEEPPVDLKWQWAGCNRVQGARKGGGVGILWRSDAGNIWTKLEGPCNEHMWLAGSILGMPVIMAVLYLSVDRGQNVENQDIIQEVLVMGDFNGHVQLIDGYQDRNGGLMLQLAERLSLEVANLRPDCIGETTWSARNSRSCIDYALTSPNLTAHMTRVHVGESGQFSLGSNHNRIALTFSASAIESTGQIVAKSGGDFEKSGIHMRQTTYAEFIDELHHTMRRYEKRVHSRGGTKRKAWWDQQVKTALEARRAANRAHRNARKITESNQKQLRTITEAGRNGPQKFWAYISSLDREAPRPIMRDAADRLCLVTEQERDSTPADCEWRVTRIVIDRAIAHIGSSKLDERVAEKSATLTELQNGFSAETAGSRTTYLCSCSALRLRARIARLHRCFLDVAKAYDSVPHNLLLSRMDTSHAARVIDLLRRLYTGNTIETRFWGDARPTSGGKERPEAGLSPPFQFEEVDDRYSSPGNRENPTMVLPDGKEAPGSGRPIYLMVRELWKSVHVPGLTFANSTICLTVPTRDWLERGQREVGRLALGCHGLVAVEAIQGDVGWSSVEAREGQEQNCV